MSEFSNFIYPMHRYSGKFTPENLVLNANLQEFSQRVSYISGLAGNGKIPMDKAFQDIEQLWQQIRNSIKSIDHAES
jgi:hypothetical protein